MTAAPSPPPVPAPATAADLGHVIRYPSPRDGGKEWVSNCHCHWQWPLDPDEAKAAAEETARAFKR